METKENYLANLALLNDKNRADQEHDIVGQQVTEYCKQYKGTKMHDHILLAIEFGYHLK